MKRIVIANSNKPDDSVRTYRNKRNLNKFIEVKKGNDGHSYMRQYMEWETPERTVKNYNGSVSNRGRYHRATQSTIDQVLQDYVEITSSNDLSESEESRKYHPPIGPKTDQDIDFAAKRIARTLKSRNLSKVTTEDVIEAFRNGIDDYDDWWARGLRTREQEKAFVDKLLEALARYGVTDVVDNTFDNVDSCSRTVQASYSPALLDDLIAEYSDYDLDLVWDLVMDEFDDEDLANDVVDGVEATQQSMGIRSSKDITSSSLVRSGCSFDFTWEDDYDMKEVESAVIKAFHSQGLEVDGVDFYSVDYSMYPEYDGYHVSQCGVDFTWSQEYDSKALQEAIESELISLGHEVVGIDFYSLE